MRPPRRGARLRRRKPQRPALPRRAVDLLHTGKFPLCKPGRAGTLLPFVQSTTCFGLHLVTGSMAGSTPPAPVPAGDRNCAPPDAESTPSQAPIPAAPLRAAPDPTRLLPPAAAVPAPLPLRPQVLFPSGPGAAVRGCSADCCKEGPSVTAARAPAWHCAWKSAEKKLPGVCLPAPPSAN